MTVTHIEDKTPPESLIIPDRSGFDLVGNQYIGNISILVFIENNARILLAGLEQ